MSNPSKARGTDFEVMMLPKVQEIDPLAIRAPLTGSQDRGDYYLPNERRFVIEAKNRTIMALPQWLREAEVEAKNAGVPFGVVWHKKKGSRQPGEQFVTMSVDTFVGLMKP